MNRPDMRLRDKRCALLRQFHQKLVSDLENVRYASAIESVHDARISARRLRVVLKALRKECHPVLLDTLLFDLRDIGRALAPVRDADVRRQRLTPLLHRIRDVNEREARRLLTKLSEVCTSARRSLKRHMHASTWSSRLQRLTANFADDGLLALPNPNIGVSHEQEVLDRHLHSIRKKLNNMSNSKQELHALRIKVKQARYICEFLAELDAAVTPTSLIALKNLQAILGKVHDDLQLEIWLATVVEASHSLKHSLRESLHTSIARRRKQLVKLHSSMLA